MAENEFIIKDGRVYLKEYTTKYSMSLTELAKQLVVKESDIETPMLPINTIKFKKSKDTYIYYVHIPENNYALNYGRRGSTPKRYVVRLPNLIFSFKFSTLSSNNMSVKMCWTFEDNIDFNKPIFMVPALDNMYEDCRFCMGDYVRGASHSESVQKYISSFFENAFNNDLSSGKIGLVSVSSRQEKLVKEGASNKQLLNVWIEGAASVFSRKENIKSLVF